MQKIQRRSRSSRMKDVEVKVEGLEKRLRRVEADLELLPTVTSFDWKGFTERDKQILYLLESFGEKGTTTLQLAQALSLNKPETSGRTIIGRRLRRIQKISVRLKGFILVQRLGRNWALNYDDFTFAIKRETP